MNILVCPISIAGNLLQAWPPRNFESPPAFRDPEPI
jgi:hypothetical protein